MKVEAVELALMLRIDPWLWASNPETRATLLVDVERALLRCRPQARRILLLRATGCEWGEVAARLEVSRCTARRRSARPRGGHA